MPVLQTTTRTIQLPKKQRIRMNHDTDQTIPSLVDDVVINSNILYLTIKEARELRIMTLFVSREEIE